jgi:hypothetical protein
MSENWEEPSVMCACTLKNSLSVLTGLGKVTVYAELLPLARFLDASQAQHYHDTVIGGGGEPHVSAHSRPI